MDQIPFALQNPIHWKDGRLAKDGLADYAAATRQLAAEEHVPFVDLYRLP